MEGETDSKQSVKPDKQEEVDFPREKGSLLLEHGSGGGTQAAAEPALAPQRSSRALAVFLGHATCTFTRIVCQGHSYPDRQEDARGFSDRARVEEPCPVGPLAPAGPTGRPSCLAAACTASVYMGTVLVHTPYGRSKRGPSDRFLCCCLSEAEGREGLRGFK